MKQVGDKIKVKDYIMTWRKYNDVLFTDDMKQYLGQEGIITKVISDGCYRIDVDLETWFWSDDMFEN